jgi:hypothetical protein
VQNLAGYIFLLLLQGCGVDPALFTRGYQPSQALSDQREFYLSQIETLRRSSGWFEDGCDALLRESLLVAGGVSSPIEDARNSDGQWFRRSLKLPECLASKGSASTISRDMIMGLMWYIWTTRDLQMAKDLWNYGEKRGWKIGESDGSIDGTGRVFLTPTILATLAQLVYELGGPSYEIRYLPIKNFGFKRGYTKHLELLDIILWEQMTGKIRPADKLIVEGYLSSDPDNAMLQYAAGRYKEADRLLRKHHPADRFPTSAESCSPMHYEHALPDPCADRNETHAPIHFLFLSKLLLNKSR